MPPCDCVGGCIAELAGVQLDACRRQRAARPRRRITAGDVAALSLLAWIVFWAIVLWRRN